MYIALGSGGANFDFYSASISGPSMIGSGSALVSPNSFTGDGVGIRMNLVEVPAGYLSGGALAETGTFTSQTFATLGFTPGTYTYALPSGDTFVITGGVPEPGTWLGGALLGGLALRGVRRRVRRPRAALGCLAALGLCLAPHAARAANILWGTAQNISADANVVTTDSLLGAFRLGFTGLNSATVNGVTFQPFALPATGTATTVAIGNFQLQFQTGCASTNTGCGSAAAPFGNLPAATRNLLQAGSYDQSSGGSITLTMSGLTVGKAYTFEWWSNNSGNFSGAGTQFTRAAGGANSVTLNNNTSSTQELGGKNGGIGQFDVGTFTADAATQTVTFTEINSDPNILNAFELRGAVPEPSTWAMLAVGGLVLLGVRRRVRRA